MKSTLMSMSLIAFVSAAMSAKDVVVPKQELVFAKTRIVDPKGRQVPAELIFRQKEKALQVEIGGRPFATVPYAAIDGWSSSRTQHHRIVFGAIAMGFVPIAGGAIMLTHSTWHWLTVIYHEHGVPMTLVLRLDKTEYQSVTAAAKDQLQ